MSSLLKKIPFVVSLVRFIRGLFGITTEKLSRDFYLAQRDSLIKIYLAQHEVKKLHIGCQVNPIPGWLNVDLEPLDRSIVIMDATKPFCLGNDTFDYVFTEHMIEHIRFEEADYMLSECFRVLKKGGKIRISTPNLVFLMDLYSNPESEIHSRYIAFSNRFIPNKDIAGFPSVIVNNFFRDWGHQFIHDRQTLDFLLVKNGFRNVVFCEVGRSTSPELSGVETHGKLLTEELNVLESLVVEAEK